MNAPAYEQITERIITLLAQGTVHCRRRNHRHLPLGHLISGWQPAGSMAPE